MTKTHALHRVCNAAGLALKPGECDFKAKGMITSMLTATLSMQMMDKAIDVHDRIMRGLLGKHFGYEVTTEGDAFQFVFHLAIDAVRYLSPPPQGPFPTSHQCFPCLPAAKPFIVAICQFTYRTSRMSGQGSFKS